MADNVTVTQGVFAADDVGGVLYPRQKLAIGADGVAVDVSSANPMPIGAPPTLPLPAGAATAAKQDQVIANTAPRGIGAMQAVPAGSTNGTALGALPAGATGARFYLGANDTVTFTVATAQPGSSPSTYTISGADSSNFDEPLAGNAMIYITAKTGTPLFRFV